MAEYDDPEEAKATFAQRFSRTGNLDQRRRFQEDIGESARRNDERLAREFENLQIRKPEVGRLELARDREARQAMEGRQRLGMEKARFERQLGRDVTMDDLAEKRLMLQQNTEKRLLRKEALELDQMDREEEDTLSFQEAEADLRRKFGARSPGYRNAMLELAVSLPYMNKELRQFALKESGVEDPDKALEEANARMEANPNIDRQTVKTGTGSITLTRPEAEKPPKENTSRRDALRLKIAKEFSRKKEEQDADYLNYLQTEFEKEKAVPKAAPVTPAAPGPTGPVATGRPPLTDIFK